MTEKEQNFVNRFNEVLMAAKEMEKEGYFNTQLAVTLTSSNAHILNRQKIIHELDKCFIDNEYQIIR